MRLSLVLLCAAMLAVPAARASRQDGFHRRPHVALQWEQHRAVARAVRAGRPVYCGGGRSNAVALTFDDGPSENTGRLIEALRAGGAHATFFVVGNRIQYWPEEVKALTGVGAVGNHSWSHPRLTERAPWVVWLELFRAQWDARAVLGWKPTLFRVPYERRSPVVDRATRSLGLVQVLWSVDSRDWKPRTTARKVVRNILPGLRPGAIVLLHEIHPWTVEAVPEILRAIRLRGLRAVSVPELLALDPPAPGAHCHFFPSAP